MILVMILIWILFFAIFFIASMGEEPSYALGAIAGIILLLFGLAIIITGVQVESGHTVSIASDEWVVVVDYSDVTLPYSTYSYVFGIIFILTSIFIIYSNAENL